MRRSDQNSYWLGAEALVALSVFALPWCFGGAPDWSLWVVLACSAIALATWLLGAARHRRRWEWHPVLLLPLVPAAVAALQLVPLPPPVLAALSAPASELRDFALAPLGLTAWRPLSLDAPSTARALARSLALGGLLFTALQLGRSDVVRARLLGSLGAVGVSVALCGFGHLIASEDALFGLHHFTGNVPLVTPFGNTNHLAAFLALTGTIALSRALDAESRDSTVGWALAALAIGVAVFLTFSRGGIGAFVATWGAVAALVVVQRARGLGGALPWVIIGATVVFAALLSFEQLVDRADTVSSLHKLQATKVELWPMFFTGALAAWPLGMGRGAFELGFARYQHQQLEETFTHPENLALQWLSDVGLPFTLVMLGLLVFVGLRLWRNTRVRTPERLVLLGLSGVLLHDVFDFALELNAVALLTAVAAGVVASSPGDDQRRAVTLPLYALALAAAIVAFVAAGFGLPTHHAAEDQLAEAVHDPQPLQAVRPLALALIDRHPSDYVLYANMANFTAVRGDAATALAWVNRLLLLRPGHARGHVAAGRALLRLGKRTQALLEFKTSFALGDRSALLLALAVAAVEGDFERLLIPERGFVTEASTVLRTHQQAAAAQTLLERAMLEGPTDEVKVEARVVNAGLAAHSGDAARALALIDALPPEERERSTLVALRARVLWRLGRTDEATGALTKRMTAEPDNLELTLLLSEIYAGAGQLTAAREVLGRIRLLVSSPGAHLELVLREAALWETDARWGKALEAVQAASRLAPARPDLRYHLASIYEHLGATHSAIDEVRKGRLLDTPEGASDQDAWLARLTAAEQHELVAPVGDPLDDAPTVDP